MINSELQEIIKHMNPLKRIKIKVKGVTVDIKSVYFDKNLNIVISDKKNEKDKP